MRKYPLQMDTSRARFCVLAAALGAIACLAAAPAAATTFKATVKAVPVGPYHKLARLRGDATLVSVTGFSQLAIDLTRLSGGASYDFSLRQAVSAGNPCSASSHAAATVPVAGWSFPTFVANAHGRGHGVGRSTSFVPDPGASYYVDVRSPGGPELACGVFKAVASKPPPKRPRQHHKRHRHKRHRHKRHRHKRHRHKHHRHKHRRHRQTP